MEETNTCEYCQSTFKTKYTLKSHVSNNKSCLKTRGLSLNNNIKCKGCNIVLTHQSHLATHQEICRDYIKYKNEATITELQEQISKKDIQLIELENLKRELLLKNQEILFQTKTITDLQVQNKQQKDTIESIAKEAINRPVTTTTNNTINHIRNNLSSKYTLEDIKDEELLNIFQENLTQQIFMSGQKGIAKMCTDKIINTVDEKKLICCTDATRKKFKYMDKNGNIKEDIEARSFVGRVSKPIKDVGKQIYENMMENLTEERENIKPDDYGKKDRLVMESFHIMDRYKDIFNIDDPKYNNDFTNELAILNKQD